jgi:hypothetical protein
LEIPARLGPFVFGLDPVTLAPRSWLCAIQSLLI